MGLVLCFPDIPVVRATGYASVAPPALKRATSKTGVKASETTDLNPFSVPTSRTSCPGMRYEIPGCDRVAVRLKRFAAYQSSL